MSGSPIKVGLILPLFSGDPATALGAATDAERLGFDGVFGFDHFFPPGAPSDRASLELFTTLAAAATLTERLTVGSLVTRAVLRPPGLVAKMAATVDAIAGGGRMVVGVGSGDPIDLAEHTAFGFPNLSTEDRRAHLQEWVTALRNLFRGEQYRGSEKIGPVSGPLLPLPAAAPPPVWVGGQAPAVVRLAARSADGWNGWGSTPENFRTKATLLREEAARAGREGAVEATWAGIVMVGEDDAEAAKLAAARHERGIDALGFHGSAESFAGFLGDLADAGASWAVLVLAGPGDRRTLVGKRTIPALRGGGG
jgi:alkanesulfonate monooxygenase SsuD/methylene tetrahydromethanopterin reductase-like flavin-dependent oxidoreductase (luciferase family)